MTHLRKMMLEELQRRNYAQNTIRSYIRTVEDFSRRFHRSRLVLFNPEMLQSYPI
jgi:integrase/recombinase XerD